MADVHHVPVLHDVVFAFQTQRAFGAGVGFGAGFEQRVPADGFGADEVVFEVGMDGSCALHGARIYGDSPGAAFVFAGGEKRNESQKRVGFADEAGEAALGQAVAGEEFGGIGVGHFGEFGFDFAADGSGSGVGAGRDFGQAVLRDRGFQVFAQVRALADVQDIEHGLLTQKHESAKTLF